MQTKIESDLATAVEEDLQITNGSEPVSTNQNDDS